MKFLAIVIALVVVHFTDYAAKFVRRHDFFAGYIEALRKPAFMRGVTGFTALLVIAALVVALLSKWLLSIAFGLPGFFFAIAVLLICLEKLPKSEEASAETLLEQALQRGFSIIFWFAIAGPVGAVLYRLVSRMTVVIVDEECTQCAQWVLQWLDWAPARLVAASFALVGHFFSVSQCWLQQAFSGPEKNQSCMLACFELAYQTEKDDDEAPNARFDYMMKLLHRAMVVWLVVLALVVLL